MLATNNILSPGERAADRDADRRTWCSVATI